MSTAAAVLESTPAIAGEAASRVGLTQATIDLLQDLIAQYGELMFHQSGGCCDGSAPMCFPAGEFLTSDADVLLHAVMDAVLGAAALGDIGRHFPDSDPAYKGADSLALTRAVAGLVAEHGFRVGNIDATILCQAPKLAPHIAAMRQNIADAFGIDAGAVSVKATTEEHLGFTGAGQGIAAHAVALLEN